MFWEFLCHLKLNLIFVTLFLCYVYKILGDLHCFWFIKNICFAVRYEKQYTSHVKFKL